MQDLSQQIQESYFKLHLVGFYRDPNHKPQTQNPGPIVVFCKPGSRAHTNLSEGGTS